MSRFEEVKAKIDTAGIVYKTEHHEPTLTSEDAARVRGVEMKTGAKAIVTVSEKSGTNYLFVIPANLKLDAKKARDVVGERVSFAKNVEEVTGCVPGSVPPFGSLFGIQTYVDHRLKENDRINFNAGSLTDSINMSYDDWAKVEEPIEGEFGKE